MLEQVGADRAGAHGQHHVVEGGAARLADGPEALHRPALGREATRAGDGGVEHRARCVERERRGLVAQAVLERLDQRGRQPRGVGGDAERRTHRVAGDVRPGWSPPPSRAFSIFFSPGGPPTSAGMSRSSGSVRHHALQQPHRRDAVDQRVVHLRVERDPAVAQPLDQVGLPQRSLAGQPGAVQPRAQLQQLADAARPGQGAVPEVVLEVEVVVLGPGPLPGRGDAAGRPLEEQRGDLGRRATSARRSRGRSPDRPRPASRRAGARPRASASAGSRRTGTPLTSGPSEQPRVSLSHRCRILACPGPIEHSASAPRGRSGSGYRFGTEATSKTRRSHDIDQPRPGGHDYVIVGAGSAGAVLAARLSEDPAMRVLLLEAGPEAEADEISMPAAFPALFKTRWDWNYATTEQKQLHNRRAYWPRMKALGGCSSMNAMIYIRGNAADYDAWRDEYGAAGWGYDDVLPYFVRPREHPTRCAVPRTGRAAPRRGPPLHPRADEPVGRERRECRMKPTEDFNGAEQEGAGLYQVTCRNGRRWSVNEAYLSGPGAARLRHRLARFATSTSSEGEQGRGLQRRDGHHRVHRTARSAVLWWRVEHHAADALAHRRPAARARHRRGRRPWPGSASGRATMPMIWYRRGTPTWWISPTSARACSR